MKTKIFIAKVFFLFFLFGYTFAQDGELPGDANCDGLTDFSTLLGAMAPGGHLQNIQQ